MCCRSHVQVENVRGVFEKIDVAHVATLRLVAEVLSRVSAGTWLLVESTFSVLRHAHTHTHTHTQVVAHSDVNRMTAGTLATSCGPSIFPYLPPSNSNQLLKFLIDNCAAVFV